MLLVLTYVSLIAGGLLVLMLLLSIISGADFDLDFDADASGGAGILKGGLTFLSIGSYTAKLILISSDNPVTAIIIGIAAGAIAAYLITKLFQWFMAQEENVNWNIKDAMLTTGRVYVPIPTDGEGVVNVEVNGARREIKARSQDGTALATGTEIIVEDYTESGFVIVRPTASLSV